MLPCLHWQGKRCTGFPMASAPPQIFSPQRRLAARRRMRNLQRLPDAPRYVLSDMVEDVQERLAFLRHEATRVLLVGDWSGALAQAFEAQGCEVVSVQPEDGFDEQQPFPFGGFDLIASLGTLDTVNDLPGALVHIRQALAPGGLMIASFVGAGSLPILREIMLAADGERPAARLHPMVDVRAGGQLLQRCGFAKPVIDSRALHVRFGSLRALVQDLRAQALGDVLVSPPPILGKAMLDRARQAFDRAADAHGRATERFEILTLSGWKA